MGGATKVSVCLNTQNCWILFTAGKLASLKCVTKMWIFCVFSVLKLCYPLAIFFLNFIWTSKLLQSISSEAEDLEWYNDPGHPQKEWSQDNFLFSSICLFFSFFFLPHREVKLTLRDQIWRNKPILRLFDHMIGIILIIKLSIYNCYISNSYFFTFLQDFLKWQLSSE